MVMITWRRTTQKKLQLWMVSSSLWFLIYTDLYVWSLVNKNLDVIVNDQSEDEIKIYFPRKTRIHG